MYRIGLYEVMTMVCKYLKGTDSSGGIQMFIQVPDGVSRSNGMTQAKRTWAGHQGKHPTV